MQEKGKYSNTPTKNGGQDLLVMIELIKNWTDIVSHSQWFIIDVLCYVRQDEQHNWTHFYFTKYFLPFPSLAFDGDISSEVTDELYVPASEPGPIDPEPSSELSADYE